MNKQHTKIIQKSKDYFIFYKFIFFYIYNIDPSIQQHLSLSSMCQPLKWNLTRNYTTDICEKTVSR
jgi:plasmid replication initiation protein